MHACTFAYIKATMSVRGVIMIILCVTTLFEIVCLLSGWQGTSKEQN